MVTRVRIEAEGSTTQEVEEILQTAHETLSNATKQGFARMFGHEDEALVTARAGEFVIERFVKDNGGIVYRGRSTAHYAEPSKATKLRANRPRLEPHSEP